MDYEKDKDNEFDVFISPLYVISNVVYLRFGQSQVSLLKKNYQDAVHTNGDSVSLLKKIIKECIQQVLRSLSKEYREKIKEIYSDDGFLYLIEYIIKSKINDQLAEGK